MEIPLFPIPDFVMFPRISVPMSIFEQRYKEMLSHLLELPPDMRLFVISTQGEAMVDHEIGTVVRLMKHEEKEDGTYEILVLGLFAAVIDEVRSDYSFRMARVMSIEEEWGQEEDKIKHKILSKFPHDADFWKHMFPDLSKISLQELISFMSFVLPLPVGDKISILSANNGVKKAELLWESISRLHIEKSFTEDQSMFN